MKNRGVKTLSIVLILAMLFSLVSCSWMDSAGRKIADGVVDDYEESIITSATTSYDPNGNILYEDVLLEDVLTEKSLLELQLEETILNELLIDEQLLYEDIRFENFKIEVIQSLDELDNDLGCEVYRPDHYDFDMIREQIAQGASLVICEVTIDVGSCVLDIIFQQWGALALDAGQLVLSVGGTTLSAFIAEKVAFAKSLAAGNSYEWAMYDALSSAAETFYYASVVINAVNAVISLGQAVYGIVQLAKVIKTIIKTYTAVISSADGAISITKLMNNKFSVIQDGVEYTCKFAQNSTDLYDISTGKYVCTIIQLSDNTLQATVRTIPSQIFRNGTLKYQVVAQELFEVTTDSNGVQKLISIGFVDEGGFIRNAANQIINRIDFDSGVMIGGFKKLVNLNRGVSVNVFGEIVEMTESGEEIPLTVRSVNGVKTYLNSSGEEILKVYEGTDGLEWLQSSETGRTVGRLMEDGLFDAVWKTELDATRSQATTTIRNALIDYVQENSDSTIRRNFPDITVEQIEYIRSYSKLPEGFEIHHCYNVANYPDLAGDLTNLEVMVSREAHEAAHGGNVCNPSSSHGPNYIDLQTLFGLA